MKRLVHRWWAQRPPRERWLVVIVLIQVIDRVVVGSLYALAGRLLIGAIVPSVRVG